jgi:hypothetical protein
MLKSCTVMCTSGATWHNLHASKYCDSPSPFTNSLASYHYHIRQASPTLPITTRQTQSRNGKFSLLDRALRDKKQNAAEVGLTLNKLMIRTSIFDRMSENEVVCPELSC